MRLPLLLALGVASAVGEQMSKIDYGRYLAVEVAKCHECHTPKSDNGEWDKSKWMKGRVLDVQPLDKITGWHKTSPDLTPSGRMWKRWGGEAAIVKYLTTGNAPNGKPADPPMPAYKLKPADAEAIVEYLKSLP